MPVLSRFYGLVITLNYGDHNPPHFHVRYQSYKALIDIKTGGMLAGDLPPKAFSLVTEWSRKHQCELEKNWERAKLRQPLIPIAPLE